MKYNLAARGYDRRLCDWPRRVVCEGANCTLHRFGRFGVKACVVVWRWMHSELDLRGCFPRHYNKRDPYHDPHPYRLCRLA